MRNFAIKTELKDYQQAAVDKILPIRVGGLFMDMGTGKSLTAISLVHHRRFRIDHVVWFCPVSLKDTVRGEIIKHTDCTDEDIHVFNGKLMPDVSWYVIGIESMSSGTKAIFDAHDIITDKTMVILDESSYIKWHRSLRTERITLFASIAKYRVMLTGTPLSQGVVDLFAQMRFLSPKILGYSSFYSFAANHLEYSEKYPGRIVRAHNVPWIAAKIKPYVYQVTKEECLTLPKKLYETRYCSMTYQQGAYYQEAKDELLDKLEGEIWDSYIIFQLFGILQQIVSGFWHRRTGKEWEMIDMQHNRLDTLMDTIAEIPPGEKIIIWAKFKYDIDHITAALSGKYGSQSVAQFHGAIPETRRRGEVDKFRAQARFFIATQSCGGHGLTLNEAHYVIFYNNGFKYSERLQAEDRCHRIGQEHPVTYIDIHCWQTIDDRIWKALISKENVADAFRSEVNAIKDDKIKLKELIKNL